MIDRQFDFQKVGAKLTMKRYSFFDRQECLQPAQSASAAAKRLCAVISIHEEK